MNTLKTLLIATTLTCFTQIAGANNSGSGHTVSDYEMSPSIGYWRSYGNEKNGHMYTYHNTTLDSCLDQCHSETSCKGVEYRINTNQQGYAENTCEIHYDAFENCVITSGMNGKALSSCWVKPDTEEDYTDTEQDNMGTGCDWEFEFTYPDRTFYPRGSDVYVEVAANQAQDIENVQLWVNNQYVRKESAAPYEWARPDNMADSYLRDMQPGTYVLKGKVKDTCGNYHEKTRTFYIQN